MTGPQKERIWELFWAALAYRTAARAGGCSPVAERDALMRAIQAVTAEDGYALHGALMQAHAATGETT